LLLLLLLMLMKTPNSLSVLQKFTTKLAVQPEP
jgi:hypothetical protein